jgi:hypothetical protein
VIAPPVIEIGAAAADGGSAVQQPGQVLGGLRLMMRP